MNERKAWRLIVFLIVIILVLIGIMTYFFFVGPAINGYIVGKQVEAKDVVLQTIINQVQQQGYVQISDSEGNQLMLVPAQQ